jgi:hypothetical protein
MSWLKTCFRRSCVPFLKGMGAAFLFLIGIGISLAVLILVMSSSDGGRWAEWPFVQFCGSAVWAAIAFAAYYHFVYAKITKK